MAPRLSAETLKIWLRIGVAAAVVAVLVLVGDPFGESEDGLVGRNSSDLGDVSGEQGRCPPGRAREVARNWFKGMSSGDADRVAAVTSRGEPVPRYVVRIADGGKPEVLRVRGRNAAVEAVPDLIDPADDLRLLEISSVGRPPRAPGADGPPVGRLAGVDFRARVGGQDWSGRVGVRCGNGSAYFAAFRISSP